MKSQKKVLGLLILSVCVSILGLLLSFEVPSNSLRKPVEVAEKMRDSKMKSYPAKPRFSQRSNNNNQWRNIVEGDWGHWEEKVSWTEQEGFYACGASVRFEQPQGNGDDTAMNGVRFIICNEKNWHQQQTSTINEGLWGDWSNDVLCPVGSFIVGLQVRYETKILFGDNTALNGLRIQCNDPSSQWLEVHPGLWGEWMNESRFPGVYICGAQSRFQPHIRMGDDTGMNGLRVQLCAQSSEHQVVNIDYDMDRIQIRELGREINRFQTVSNPTNTSKTLNITFEFSERKSHLYEIGWFPDEPFKFSSSARVIFRGDPYYRHQEIQKEINEFINFNQTYSFGRETFSPLREISNYIYLADPCTETRVTATTRLMQYRIPFRMVLIDVFQGRIERAGTLIGTLLNVPRLREQKRVIPNCSGGRR